MPAQPAWFHRLEEILACREASTPDTSIGKRVERLLKGARAAHRRAIPSPVRAYAAWWSSALSFRL